MTATLREPLDHVDEHDDAAIIGTLLDVKHAREAWRQIHGDALDDQRPPRTWMVLRHHCEAAAFGALQTIGTVGGDEPWHEARHALLTIAASAMAQLEALDRAVAYPRGDFRRLLLDGGRDTGG